MRLLLLAAFAVSGVSALAEDPPNVRGGFFEKDFVNKGMLKSREKEETPDAGGDKERGTEPADSWSIEVRPPLPAVSPEEREEPDDLSREQPNQPTDSDLSTDKAQPPKVATTYRLNSLPQAASDGVLSVLVTADPPQHLDRVIRQLHRFRRSRPVPLGELIVIGQSKEFEFFDLVRPRSFGPGWKEEYEQTLARAQVPPEKTEQLLLKARNLKNSLSQLLLDLGIAGYRRGRADRALERLKPQLSPVWVVRYRGSDHVFEGDYDPLRLFDESGRFIGKDEEREEA